MIRKSYLTPRTESAVHELALLFAVSEDAVGGDMPIDEIELTF